MGKVNKICKETAILYLQHNWKKRLMRNAVLAVMVVAKPRWRWHSSLALNYGKASFKFISDYKLVNFQYFKSEHH